MGLLMGQPGFGVGYNKPWGPIGQYNLIADVRLEIGGPCPAIFREEYMAIATAIRAAGERFRVVNPGVGDTEVRALCDSPVYVNPAIKGVLRMYPRDMVADIGPCILINGHYFEGCLELDGKLFMSSPFGEGGVLLSRGGVGVTSYYFGPDWEAWSDPEREDLGREAGLNIAVVSACYTRECESYFSDPHIDRVASLVEGVDGGMHLLLDPQYVGYDYKERLPTEPIDVVKRSCEPLEIEVHTPKRMMLPYSVSVLQLPNGNVVMTSGDEVMYDLVCEIVGEDRVFLTPVPIRAYPAYAYAGIHCLVTEYPDSLGDFPVGVLQ